MPRVKTIHRGLRAGSLGARIVEALTSTGPMTRGELQNFLNYACKRQLAATLVDMRRTVARRSGAKVAKFIHIKEWSMHCIAGGKTFPRPVYAVGNRPDAAKPEPVPASVYKANYLARKRIGRGLPNSIFALGAACS
jgi:hypothetical protein